VSGSASQKPSLRDDGGLILLCEEISIKIIFVVAHVEVDVNISVGNISVSLY